MREIVRSTVVTLALTVVATAVFAAPVQTDAFSITLPEGFGEFATQAQSADSPEGKIETTNWISKAAATGEAVVVTVSKMPGKIGDAEKAIAGARDSLLKSLNATLETEEKLEGEQRASNLLFKSNGAFLRSQLVVDEDRMIQVLYVGRSEEQRGNAAVGELFSTFKLAEPPAVTETTAQ
jgi:hypothetical protein